MKAGNNWNRFRKVAAPIYSFKYREKGKNRCASSFTLKHTVMLMACASQFAQISMSYADYDVPALTTYRCQRLDSGSFTLPRLTVTESVTDWGEYVITLGSVYAELTNWYLKETGDPREIYRYACEADNGLPPIVSPPYQAYNGILEIHPRCRYYDGQDNLVEIGSPVGISNPDGSVGLKCRIYEPLPKENDQCVEVPVSYGGASSLYETTDYEGAGLDFGRSYSSTDREYDREIGVYWRHNYDRKLLVTGGEQRSAVVSRENGRNYQFTKVDNSWVSDPDVKDKLEELTDGDGTTVEWHYRVAADNSLEKYDAAGKLISITELSGAKTTLTYSDSAVPGYGVLGSQRLVQIDNQYGKSLHIAYDSFGRVSTVVVPSGESYQYVYDENSNLISANYAGGNSEQYLYEDTRFTHALTGITDENGNRYATWTYDSEGRAISSEHAGGVDKTTLAYNSDGTTTVTNPLGKQTTYHFTTIHGVKKVTQVEGHPTTSCEGANKSYSYDANGNIASKTDWNGVTTTYTYDMARNLELTRTEAVGAPQERTITTEWHPLFRLPTKITEPGRVTEYTYDAHGRRLSSSIRGEL